MSAGHLVFPQRHTAAQGRGCCQVCTIEGERARGLECSTAVTERMAVQSELRVNVSESSTEDSALHKVDGRPPGT